MDFYPRAVSDVTADSWGDVQGVSDIEIREFGAIPSAVSDAFDATNEHEWRRVELGRCFSVLFVALGLWWREGSEWSG